MTLGILWFKQKLPYIKIPIPPMGLKWELNTDRADTMPFFPVEIYKPTGSYNFDTKKYEYVFCGWE